MRFYYKISLEGDDGKKLSDSAIDAREGLLDDRKNDKTDNLEACLELLEDVLLSEQAPEFPEALSALPRLRRLYDCALALRASLVRFAKGDIRLDVEGEGYVIENLRELREQLTRLTTHTEMRGEDGYSDSARMMGDLFGSLEGMTIEFSDTIAALKESEANLIKLTDELHESEDRLRLASACTQDGIWDIDLCTGKAFFSPRLWEIFRWPYTIEDDVAFNPQVWSRFIHPDDRERWLDCLMTTALKRKGNGSSREINYSEFRMKGGDGKYRWVASHHMLLTGEDGVPYRFIGACQDIQERREHEEAIRMQATHDQLTGLPNRYLYNDRLAQMMVMSKRGNASVVLVIWDLDAFKAVNDTYGHLAGDHLLAGVAGRMRSCLRETDTLARFGGDEFVMILASASGNEAEVAVQTTDRIFEALSRPIDIGSASLTVSASCGISFFPRHATDGEKLLALADEALFHAKRSGKNRAAIWSPEMNQCK